MDRAGLAGISAQPCPGVIDGYRDPVVDRHAVVDDADDGRLDLLAVLEDGGMEVDVVALPDRGGLAGIDPRRRDFVDPPAIVVLALQPVAVEDLHLVASLEI